MNYLADTSAVARFLLRDAGRVRDLGGVRPWRFPGVEEVIVACLDPVPAARPSASELVKAVGNYSERGSGVRG